MYATFARAVLYTPVAAFVAFLLSAILGPMIDVMQAGEHSGDAGMTIGYFEALTEANMIVIFGLSLALMLIGRAAVEARLGGGI